jgi:predicted Zn-dependent protease
MSSMDLTKTKAGLCALIGILLAAFAAACVTNTETKRRQFIVVPDSQMNAMGASTYAQMKQTEKVSKDPRLNAAITEVGRRIAQASGRDYDWEFTLFDSKDVNAWCLPGGKVGVYTGLLPVALTNAGLATVMGHEVAHAVLRHGSERVSQSLVVAGVMLTLDQALSDSKRKPYVMAALGLGAQFGVILPYSRKQETEADDVGLQYMARAGFDPAEAVELWGRMAQAGGPNPPEFLSTHPNPASRARALRAQLGSVRSLYDASSKIPTQKI